MPGARLTPWIAGGLLLLSAGPGGASHDWFGVDLCRSDPGRMPPALQAADLPQAESPGAQLLGQYCAQCHNLPHPGQHTAGEWPDVTRTMHLLAEVTARFDGLAGLRLPDAGQRAQIDAYLRAHALRPLPAGTQAPAVYLEVCGDCHAAPDPSSYSSAQWPAVFARMAGHRASMARPPVDPLRATRVLAFLSDHAAPAGQPAAGGRGLALAPVAALGLFALWRLYAGLRQRARLRRRPV